MNRINRSWVDVNRLGSPVTNSMIEVVAASSLDRVIAERDGLQISLNTADQSIDDLNAAISRRTHRVRELEAQLAYAMDALNEVVKASAMYEKPFEIATLAIGEMSAVKPQAPGQKSNSGRTARSQTIFLQAKAATSRSAG